MNALVTGGGGFLGAAIVRRLRERGGHVHSFSRRRYHELDLSLDPFPYNGHTSTFDALWMGVPVITLSGRTGVGRAGVSILSHLGLPELIAETHEHYVAIAVAWATDLPRLAALRAELRTRLEASTLVDGPQYAADSETAASVGGSRWRSFGSIAPGPGQNTRSRAAERVIPNR